MDELQKLYDVLVREGKYTKSFDEFKNKWSSDTDYQNRVFDVVSRDGLYTKDKQSFFQKYSGAAPVFEQQVTEQTQVKKKEPIPSVSGAIPSVSQKPASQFGQQFAEMPKEPSIIPQVYTEEGKKTYVPPKPTPQTPKINKEPEEEDYFTGAFGNVLRGIDNIIPLGIGDFVDDMSRAIASGYRQGDVAQYADKLLLSGAKSTPEEIQNFINKQKTAQQLGPSKEMQEYQKIYEQEGKGFWGVVKGLANNPSILPEVTLSSLTGMATNIDALTAAGSAVGTGAAYGGATGAAAGGVGAVPGAAAGAIASVPYAFGLASTVVEMGSTFSELLKEELGEKEMTKENVKAILENPEKLQKIRNKAVARGIVIGTIDTFTGKLASGVGAKVLSKSAAKSATGAATKGAVVGATAAGSAIESTGGAVGEAAARATIGQEMDTSEIALEGLGELPGGIRSTIQARFAKPSYKVNGEKVSVEQVDELINTMTPEELAKTKIDIENDYEGRKFKIQDKLVTYSIKEQVKKVNPDLDEESINQLTDLEKQLQGLENNKTQVAKDKASEIKSQIKTIQDNAIQKQTTDEGVLRTEQPQVGLQEVGKGDQVAEVITEEAKPKEEVVLRDATVFSFDNLSRQPLDALESKAEEIQDKLDSATNINDTEDIDLYTRQLNAINKQIELAKEEVSLKTQAKIVTEEAKPKEEVVTTQVNVAPYFNTKIETIEDAQKLRENEDYKKHKESLLTLAKDLGIPNAKVDDVIGGYYNEETDEDFIEISNVVSLEDATIDQAEEFAALAAVTSPEVQQATIAAQYVDEAADTHNANEYVVKVSDVNGAMKSLKEAGISDFTVNEKDGTVSFIDVFDFSDGKLKDRIGTFVKLLNQKGINYEQAEYSPIESRYVDKGTRREILRRIESERTQPKQGRENLYTQIDQAIARDAEFNGIPIEEYLGREKVEQTAEQEVENLESLLRENRLSTPYKESSKKNAAQIENHRRLAELARKSLAKIAPDVKIILHETAEDYDKAVPKPSQGYFNFDTNTIHINLQYADVETVPHEVFHAILAIKIKTDPRATQVAKEMMESVMKVLDKDSPVYKQIEKLSRSYEETLQDEEKLAELFGILSVNYEKLPQPAKSAIVRFIEKIAKLFGLDATKLIGRTDESVIRLLNTLSEKVAKGQEIQEGEIAILGAGGDGTRTSLFRDVNKINDIVKLARANGFSEQAISTVLKNRGFSEEEITNALTTELGAKGTVEVTEELLPGKEELLKKVDAMIKRQQSKNVTKQKIAENVKKLMEKSDAYNNATDIQKEKLIRDANKKIGIREKAAPSEKALKQGVETEIPRGVSAFDRFFGAIEPEKKITMTEKQAFAEAMKNADRGGKDAKKKWMAISNELTKQIKKLRSSGKITANQAASVLRKFSGVNVFDNASIDRFVEYMSKVFENAEYAEKISNAFAKLPTAKKNARTKLGIAESLTPALNRMLSIKPTLIPDAVLDSYLGIIDMIGKKAEVLTLEEVNSLTKKVNDILDAVDTEVSKADELAERFNEYQDKVVDENGKLDYSATIKAMLKDNTISDDEAEIMRKYKSSIVEPVERVKKTEEELAEEKEQLISAIKSSTVDSETLPTRDERDLAKELASLAKTDAIKELSNNQLKNLFKTIDNINNGYLTHYAQLMVEKLNAINNAKTLSSGIQNASPLSFSKLYANLKSIVTRKGSILEMIRRNPLAVIDQVFGNFKDKPIFNSLFEKSAEAETKYKSDVTKVQHKLSDAQEAVAKSFNNDANKTLMSSFKMMTYMIQLEHDSNIDSKQVNQAADYLKATIKHIDEGKSEFGERDANMLQDIVDKYTNEEGQIDIDKLYKSFNDAEKNAIKTVREINESLTEKAVYTASIIRGDKIAPLNNYVHLNVLHESLPQDNIAGASSMEQYNQSIMPSSKAKSLIERTGKVSPLNFDIFTSANRGANFVLMDYHLTQPIRTARKTINETTAMLEKDGRMSKKDRELLNAVKDAYEEVVSNVLTNNFINTSIADDVMDFMTRQGYRAVLASAPRFVSELSSNISYALLAEPNAFAKGVELRGIAMSTEAVDIMNNVDSKQTTRLFHGDTLSGRLVDTSTLNQVSGIRGGRGKSDVANKTQQIYNNSLKKYKNFVELTADALISTPDKMVMRPIWFGAFANEFENVSGKKPDFDKIAANDEAYMSENKDAIDKARNSADDKTVRAGATENAFMGILKGTVKPNQSALLRGFNTFNNFMTKFMIYEYVTARAGINAAMGNGSVSRKQGVALIAGVTSRMLVYSIMTQMLGSAMVGLITGDDDDEDDKTFLQKIGQYIASTATGLILGRDYGNATKSMINYGVEKMNEKYLDFLREGDYDPYQDAIQYTVIPTENKKSQTDLGDLLMKVGGALGPSMKTADLIIKKATGEPKKEGEAIEREAREIKQRIPLEILGNTGFIPLYKDVRKVLMSDMYKELRQSKGPTKKEIEQQLLQGYDTREDMKRYDPKLYEQTFGKGSPTYKVDKMIKDIEKQQKDMEQKIKDMTYGYTGKTKKKK